METYKSSTFLHPKIERYMGFQFRDVAMQIEHSFLELARRTILPRVWNFPGTEKIEPAKLDPNVQHLSLSRDIIMLASVLDAPIYVVTGYIPEHAFSTKDQANCRQHIHGHAVDVYIPDEDPLITSAIIYELIMDRQFDFINRAMCAYGIYHLGHDDMVRFDFVTLPRCMDIAMEIYATHGALDPVIFKV